MILIQVFLQVAAVTVATAVIFEDCGSAYDLDEVTIEGCGMRLPCYVTLGENVPVNVKFYADFVSTQLDQEVVININHISLRTNVTPEPCATVHCPVKTNAATSFTSVMSVPTNMAVNQRGYLRWRVLNESGRLVLCYAVLVQTQTPTQKILRQTMPAKTLSDSTEYRNNETANSKVPFASFLNLNKRNTSVFSYLEDIMKRSYHTNITAVSYGDDVTSHGRDVLDNLNVK